jgi:hypothetical protein
LPGDVYLGQIQRQGCRLLQQKRQSLDYALELGAGNFEWSRPA